MKVHGEFSVSREGRIVITEAEGPWNEAAAAQYRQELDAKVTALAPDPWRQVVIFHGEAILIPEAEAQLIEITRWRMSMGLVRIAIVLEGVNNPPLVRAQFTSVYDQVGLEYRFFERRDDAMDWMLEG